MKQKEFGQKALKIDDQSYVTIKNQQGNRYLVIDEFGFENWLSANLLHLIDEPNIYQNSPQITAKDAMKSSKKGKFEAEFFVIDLHAEKLKSIIQQNPKWPLLALKIRHCEQQLDYAIQHRLSKIKIIHGMGDGTLQNAIYQLLSSKQGLEYDDDGFFKESMAYVLVYLR
jgi:hypothetical protein